MVYTLVSAATLGFDLARLPGGRQVAEVLLTGLLADGAVVRDLSAQHRTRLAAGAAAGARPDAGQARRARVLATGGLAGGGLGDGGSELVGVVSRAPAALLAHLERSTLGSVAALDRLVHGELVAAGTGAGPDDLVLAREVLADAAVAAYAADALLPEQRRLLTAAHRAAVGERPRAVGPGDLGPLGADVLEVLDAVTALDGPGRARWRAAAETSRDDRGTWARALHEACWAAHVSGRTRATAAAQLMAVRALDDGGATAADAAGGVWNALAGVVHGTALADLLPDGVLAHLLAPWHRVREAALL